MRTINQNTVLLDGPGVWMEGSALVQLERVAALPGCAAAAGMPDLHAGAGPVGAAFAFADGAHPALIGGDAGCGVRMVALRGVKAGGDALERRVREHTEGPALPGADMAELLAAVWAHGPRGLAAVAGVPDSLAELAATADTLAGPPSAAVPEDVSLAEQLGTTGAGNHFLELGQVEHIVDRASAARGGLAAGELVVLAHSGSRGLGYHLATRWPREAQETLTGAALAAWQAELLGACRFAAANRLVLAWRMLLAVGAARPGKIAGTLDVIHNTVEPSEHAGVPVWLHRKGCAPAAAGQLTVVLGSRGAPSFVMEGLGCEAALSSVAHGAGRRMTRTEAREKVRAKHSRASLTRTAIGSRVLCDDPALLYEEHPDAYKAIVPVVDALEAAGAARRVAELRPVITVKW
ncbi:MAG: RtcB family protein [Pseudomonadota bacterium]|nr:RtcB family protein [Pseudomonadota bacterium]